MTRPLRIGIVTDGLEEQRRDGTVEIANGGVGVYIYNLIKHLRLVDEVNEYTLIRCGVGHLDVYDSERSHNVFFRTGSAAHDRNLMTRALSALATPAARLLDLDLPRVAAGLDVIHYPNQFGGAFLPPSIRRLITVHDITPLLLPRLHPRFRVVGHRLLIRRSLRRAHRIIVQAAHTARDLADRGLADHSKISVVPLGVDTRFHPGIRTAEFAARYDLPSRFVLNVGVLEPRKNHGALLSALRLLHRRGETLALVIVGREGWRWRDPLASPELAPLRPWVRIVRNVPDADLPEFYCRAQAFAYPSFYEGFGLPILEAMASGVPVVTSNTSSLPEVAGGAALLADPGDASALADHLLSVVRDASLRRQLVDAGLDHVRRYSWRRTAEQTLALYEDVCRGVVARA